MKYWLSTLPEAMPLKRVVLVPSLAIAACGFLLVHPLRYPEAAGK